METQPLEQADPRRKRAIYIVGAIGLAAIAWNWGDWREGSSDNHNVSITVDSDAEPGEHVKVEFRGDETVSDTDVATSEETAEANEQEAAQAGSSAEEPAEEANRKTGFMM